MIYSKVALVLYEAMRNVGHLTHDFERNSGVDRTGRGDDQDTIDVGIVDGLEPFLAGVFLDVKTHVSHLQDIVSLTHGWRVSRVERLSTQSHHHRRLAHACGTDERYLVDGLVDGRVRLDRLGSAPMIVVQDFVFRFFEHFVLEHSFCIFLSWL